ncbi:spoVID-dependent spore coat assembly factor; FtsK/SpoIIIE family protein; surface protein [Bacillus cereus]|nr:spoVID-dependent spore coat assembly factor; FtsK/SpoIIIE family protein; surface protein [Bacillus cereus]
MFTSAFFSMSTLAFFFMSIAVFFFTFFFCRFKLEKPVEKPSVIQKPPVIEKQKPAEKENTKFSVNVLPQPPQPPIKTKKNIKFQM